MGEKETTSAEELERRQHPPRGVWKAADDGESGAGEEAQRDVSERATWTTSNPGIKTAATEAQLLKNKTKSNQSNDRTAQEGDAGSGMDAGGEAQLLKNKTKSNQSNDRMEQESGGGGGDGAAEGGVNTSHSNIKNLREADVGEDDWTDDNTDDDESPEAKINNTKSNIKNREAGITDAPETTWPSDEAAGRESKPRHAVLEFREAGGGGGSAETSPSESLE